MAARYVTTAEADASRFNDRRRTDPRLGPSVAARMKLDDALAWGLPLADAIDDAERARAAAAARIAAGPGYRRIP